MDRICEIDRRRPARKLYDLSHRSECINVFREKIELERFDKILRIVVGLSVLDQRKQQFLDRLTQFVEALIVFTGSEFAFFVFPMRSDTFFGDLVHFLCSYLHLEWLPAVAD